MFSRHVFNRLSGLLGCKFESVNELYSGLHGE